MRVYARGASSRTKYPMASATGRRVLSHAACSVWSARFGRYHARWRVLTWAVVRRTTRCTARIDTPSHDHPCICMGIYHGEHTHGCAAPVMGWVMCLRSPGVVRNGIMISWESR